MKLTEREGGIREGGERGGGSGGRVATGARIWKLEMTSPG